MLGSLRTTEERLGAAYGLPRLPVVHCVSSGARTTVAALRTYSNCMVMGRCRRNPPKAYGPSWPPK